MDKKKRYKKIIIHGVLIFVALFLILRFVKEKTVNNSERAYALQEITEAGEYSELHQINEANALLVQKFTATTDVLMGLGLRFDTQTRGERGAVEAVVLDEQGRTIFKQTIPMASIEPNRYRWLIFDKVEKDSRGKEYELSLRAMGQAEECSIGVFVNHNPETTTGTLEDTNGKIAGNMWLGQMYARTGYLVDAFNMFAIMIVVLICGLYVCIFVVKLSKERIFLIAMIVVGLIYAILIKPGTIPDETGHYLTSYAYSNVLLGKGDGLDNFVVLEESDNEFFDESRNAEPTLDTYKDFLEQFGRSQINGEMVTSNRYALSAPAYLYIPQMLGITVGRVLSLNALTSFYLGRIFNVILFAIMAFIAIKKLPAYKMSMFAICMLPMTAQLVGSLSYDSIILAIALVFCSYTMALMLKEDDSIVTKELVVIAISGAFLAGCKSGAYMALFGLLFLISKKCFKKRSHKMVFLGVVLLGMLAMFSATSGSIGSSTGDTNVGWAGSPPYTIGWVLTNPMKAIQIISNTLFEHGDMIVTSLIGKTLAWFNVPIQMVTVIGFIIVLLLTGIYVEGESKKVILLWQQKSKILISCILSVAVIAAAMMFSWTPLGFAQIEGIQGRYFLALLLPLMACLKSTTLVFRKSFDRELIFALGWLQVAALVSVFVRTILATV